jgi:mannose-1-phosphate guanylyltransferase
MHALILAGGKGTRLRPLTVYTPKPIVPVVNRPFLLYQLDILSKAGITDVTLSLSYQPDKIEDLLGDGSDFGVNLRFVAEPSPLGTAGAYKFAADDIRDATIVLNGDILTDVDLAKIVELHRAKKAVATIALAAVDDPTKYGLVKTNAEGRVVQFTEKPKSDQIALIDVNTINAGIYVLEPSVFDAIPDGENSSFEYNIFPSFMEGSTPFYGYVLQNEYWRDIGTPESYLAAHHDILAGKVSGIPDQAECVSEITTTAFIDEVSVIGEGCVIKSNSRIVNSVLGAGVHVEEKAVIENSVIWPHSRVSGFAHVDNAVIGRGCHIGRNVTVRSGSVIGDKATLPDYSKA